MVRTTRPADNRRIIAPAAIAPSPGRRAACLAFAIAACSGDGDSPSSPNNGGREPAPVSSVSITPATVDANGLVTGVAAGSANIVAASEGKSAQAAITVSLVPVASVTVTPNAPAVKVRATAALAATVKDENGNVLTGRTVDSSSSAPAIATVDAASGVVTG